MSEAPGGPPPSRLEQARAMARAQAAARQERRAGRHAEIQTASKSTVSYLWLIQTYIVRALCLIYAVGTIMDIAGGRVPMVGGVIGIVVGLALPYSVRFLTNYRIPISGLSAIIAIIVSSLVGIIFGTVPATRASQLDPVESLRYE